MAENVFGIPITNSTLEAMPEYKGKTISRLDRAHVALLWKNVEGKDEKARDYVNEIKAKWGHGLSTRCLIYNATGDSLSLVKNHDWHGHIGPVPFPNELQNGQWGAFLHVKSAFSQTGSSGAVVYRGLNNNDSVCEWLPCWSNPPVGDNTAYTEIREEGHYEKNDYWDYIYNSLENSGLIKSDNWNECVSNVSIGSEINPIFEAILTLKAGPPWG